ncbi:N-acetylneuraminate synthase family protein [uncultured Thalassospira sp.]|uniref:N-acetylneuraminate synthase family protein n=1 Tax=uncultured Thalassospira sp. TaxID=404382 RepID=UPI00258DD10C|nr:N-acetylneuraminate synthase family protein [uncultured Thalassospira sp.]
MSLAKSKRSSSSPIIQIGGRAVGLECPPLLLPDIGTFFNSNVEEAIVLIDSLIDQGVEIIKGEILHDPSICLDDGTLESYYSPKSGLMVEERYRDLIERKVVSLDDYDRIFRHCRNRELAFVLSVYDFAGADFALQSGAAALKVASSNIVHEPLIRYLANTRKPLVIDTGRSTMDEIDRALSWARSSGAEDIILEHSPPPPPAPVEHQNIRILDTFADKFDCLTALSDHHSGPEMLYAAAARGVSLLEKGVCSDDKEDDQDVAHALRVSDFSEVNRVCQTIYSGIGVGELPPVKKKKTSRMGLVAAKNLSEGEYVSSESVSYAFPALGIPVEYWSRVNGSRITKSVEAGKPLEWDHVDDTTA